MKKTESWSKIHVRIVALLVLNLAVWLAWLLKEDGAIKLEKLRAWWADNFASIMSFYESDEYKKQQSDNIPTLLEQLKGWSENPAPTQAANPTPSAGATANETIKAALEDIQENAYIQWKKNTRYTLLEYSDLECPFCKRHFQNGTVEALLEKYPDDINHVFRHFPLTSIHPNAQLASEAAECAAEAKGSDAFYELIEEMFNLPSLSRDAIVAAASSIGISESSMNACLDSGKFSNKVNEELNEGQSLFGIRWTPGNVIVDNETGRFVAIPWAYPIDKFVLELDNLMANE